MLMSTILVIDDMVSELELMSRYLRDSGYTVINATDAREALSKIDQFRPDAIVTDVVMPGMSGLELCRAIKGNPATEKLPIIACTTKNQEIDRLWGMKQGVNVYVTKPCTKEQLVQAVKSVVG